MVLKQSNDLIGRCKWDAQNGKGGEKWHLAKEGLQNTVGS